MKLKLYSSSGVSHPPLARHLGRDHHAGQIDVYGIAATKKAMAVMMNDVGFDALAIRKTTVSEFHRQLEELIAAGLVDPNVPAIYATLCAGHFAADRRTFVLRAAPGGPVTIAERIGIPSDFEWVPPR